jgi:hypothetical protein
LRGSDRRVTAVALAYGTWLLPAVLGSIFDWSWWVVLTLLVPGLVWYTALVQRPRIRCWSSIATWWARSAPD